ncbi:hypothetical protein ACHHYP_11837 [Achlya hypogyna]|uniref:Transmembrane protein n=1 Tax=Achlya hypogyna TaxID=1202772 RepID=A0A1V9YI72_ACHHY|nr:hypothetical protein ACHHYP_11837 [Achlya hypogyna]
MPTSVSPEPPGPHGLRLRRATTLVVAHDRSASGAVAWCIAGAVYLVGSIAADVYYLSLLEPSVINDLFWAGFNTTGMQSFVADAFNQQLSTTDDLSVLALDAPALLFPNDYGSADNRILVNPAYPRAVLSLHLTTVPDAIKGLRAVTMDYAAWLPTQNCWVDFDRRWELAHTLKRQARCAVVDVDNGAVYLEALLRNVDWEDWSNAVGEVFETSISSIVAQSDDGERWVAATAEGAGSIDDEVALWRSKNVTRFALQWHNLWQSGITETVYIENALGMQQSITIKNIPRAARDYTWTSLECYWGLFNDLWASSVLDVPLVRINGSEVDFEVVRGYNATVATVQLVHAHVGPFLSIDMRYVPLPASLIAYVGSYRTLFGSLRRSSARFAQLLQPWEGKPRAEYALPPSWVDDELAYYGGSPICLAGTPQAFAQPSFGFFDACGSQVPNAVGYDVTSLLFAVAGVPALTDPAEICTTSLTAASCAADMASALAIRLELPSDALKILGDLSAAAQIDVMAISVEVMQFAFHNTTGPVLLRHPLLAASSAWNVFGWLQLFDWVGGIREVISFEGDVGTLTLASVALPPEPFDAIALEVPHSTCMYLWYLSLYASFVLSLLAAFVLVRSFFVEFRIAGRNLFFFNRVAAFVWVGRPVFLIRGLTGVILLSTAPLTLEAVGGWTHVVSRERSWLENALIASEATWLSYVSVDVLLVAFSDRANLYAPSSSMLTWAALTAYSTLWPVTPTASIVRSCSSVNLDVQLLCEGGGVAIGSYTRTQQIATITLGCLIGSLILVTFGATSLGAVEAPRSPEDATPLDVPAAAEAFLNLRIFEIGETSNWCMDYATCALCGLIPFEIQRTQYVFDVKLWVVWTKHQTKSTLQLRSPSITLPTRRSSIAVLPPPIFHPLPPEEEPRWHVRCCRALPWHFIMVFVGCSYVVATVSSSVVFYGVAGENMANDFFWPGFNTTGMNAFIGNWYNDQLFFVETSATLYLDDIAFGDTLPYNATTTLIATQPLYTNVVYFETMSALQAAVMSLRTTPATTLPWVFTQFCYVDLARRWAMANSEARQERCDERYKTNAAVYLEIFMRNTDWHAFEASWGRAFALAVGAAVEPTWLAQTTTDEAQSVHDEAAYWASHGILTFTLQWQNYKSIGIHDAFAVRTAFGLEYTMTLKSSKGAWRLAEQTSLKMYWAFANDLQAVASNGSDIAGRSLVRSDASFAFANTTMTALLVAHGTLSAPFGPGFAALEELLGPFGSIDMFHVATPRALLKLQQHFNRLTSTVLATIPAAATAFSELTVPSLSPTPSTWCDPNTYALGGNVMCEPSSNVMTRDIQSSGLIAYFGTGVVCGSSFGEYFTIAPNAVAFAPLVATLSGLAVPNISASCEYEMLSPPTCVAMVQSGEAFAAVAYSVEQREELTPLVAAAVAAVQDTHVQVMQYAWNGSATVVLTLDLLSPTDPLYVLFAWCALWDWASGFREVVSFQGDAGVMNLLSTATTTVDLAPNPLEIPENLALVLRTGVIYITSVLVGVSLLVLFNLLGSHGQISGSHLLGLNRVAGIVWVGRPLLFVRSMTAMCVLSTARLDLVRSGTVTYFKTAVSSPLLTILSAGEIGWLVYVLNDVLMVYTQQYARRYTTKATYLLWAISAIWTFVAPVRHSVVVARSCAASDLNLLVVCDSGVLTIGDSTRFVTLTVLCFACILVFYGIERVRSPNLANDAPPSHYLSCEAKYLYKLESWQFNGVYYLDKASAAMNGMLIVSYSGTFYVLDIKTWRRFRLHVPRDHYYDMDAPTRRRLKSAYPLVE